VGVLTLSMPAPIKIEIRDDHDVVFTKRFEAPRARLRCHDHAGADEAMAKPHARLDALLAKEKQ
jgi:hypothetical protein